MTEAEANDGKLVFEVEGKDPVTVVIPVLGADSPTWPWNCKTSEAIVRHAAEYYAQSLQKARDSNDEGSGIPAALRRLLLLSTGNDAYLPGGGGVTSRHYLWADGRRKLRIKCGGWGL